jgi:sugar/nucleoside kinase (ribokinase family)
MAGYKQEIGEMLRVLCIGDNNVDIYPEQNEIFPGGNAVNVAAFMRELGCETAYMGIIGNDRSGKLQIDSLKASGVDVSHMRICPGETAYTYVDLIKGDRVFRDFNIEINRQNPIGIDPGENEYIASFSHVHTSCWSFLKEGVLGEIKNLCTHISFDFSTEWDEKLIEKICPQIEIAFFSLSHVKPEQRKGVLRLARESGADLAIGTMGNGGSMAYNGNDFKEFPVHNINIIDPIGAGDAFISAFLKCYMSEKLRKENWIKDILQKQNKNPDLSDYDETILRMSMMQGTLFAERICMKHGAFGKSISYREF